MGCFEKLVKSHFFANVSAELKLARQTIRSMSQFYFEPALIFNKKEKKAVYKELMYNYYLMEEIVESMDEFDDKDMVFYIQSDHIVFIYSQSQKQLKEAVQYSYNLNGDLPLCRSKHRVNNKLVYTALIDTRLQFEVISPN